MENLSTSQQINYQWRVSLGRGGTCITYWWYIGDNVEVAGSYGKLGTLWYTGKRWVMWVMPLNLVAVETEYYDVNNPPKELVETMATMA
jgi:hypothetical protein